VVVSYTDVIDMEYDPTICTKQKACTSKWQFVVDTHIFLPFEEEYVKMVIQQTGASHDQATSSLRDAGGDLVDAMLLLENSNTLIYPVISNLLLRCGRATTTTPKTFFFTARRFSGGHSHEDDKQGHGSRFGSWKAGSRRGVVAGQWACSVWGAVSEATAAQSECVPLPAATI
jgi:hypothetical protein